MSTTRAGQASVPDTSQFSIDRTYPGRWTITFSNPPGCWLGLDLWLAVAGNRRL